MNRTAYRTLTAIVLAATAVMAGCSGDPGGPLYVDSRFTAAERAEIQAAADQWAAHGAVIDLVWDAKTTCRNGNRRELCRYGSRAAAALDPTFRDTERPDATEKDGRLIIDVEYAAQVGDPLQALVAHEMGHMLGLAHVGTAQTAVMSAFRNAGSPTELTTVDIQECVGVGACVRSAPSP